MKHPNEAIMQRAIDLAKASYKEGGHAIAAIVVRYDKILAEAFTTILRDKDPTAHAEMNAIRAAAKELGSASLRDCYLYTTYEPCPMCSSAAIWANMRGIVYGASMEDQTPHAPQRVDIPAAYVIERGTPTLELLSDEEMREACAELLHLRADD